MHPFGRLERRDAVGDGERRLIDLLRGPVLQAGRRRHEREAVRKEVEDDGDADDDERDRRHVRELSERRLVARSRYLRDDLPEDEHDEDQADDPEDDRLLLVERGGRRCCRIGAGC